MFNQTNKPNAWKSRVSKLVLIMRLTIVIILITVFQLSAARSYGQQFTYTGKNIPLIKFFKEIKKQTGYSTVWSGDDLDLTETVDADYHNAPLEEVLKTSLAGLPIDYVIVDKTISLKGNGQLSKIKAASDSASLDIRGRVVDEENRPLVGATVKIKGTSTATQSNAIGDFNLKSEDEKAVLIISHVGFKPVTVSIRDNLSKIKMTEVLDRLKQIEVVSTGYQQLPKERATGSFVLIDNELLNRSVSTNILDRLKGVTSGVLFDQTTGTDIGFSIRGRNTIFANTNPLIVLDNFPYDGDLGTINPNDIESISILKDAAAASIWGVRASNGVVVLTTKKGRLNQLLKIGVNSNITFTEKPDLFSDRSINTSDYIDLERFLYNKGHFSFNLENPSSYISPVVEILSKVTDESEIDRQLDLLRIKDVRNDMMKYYYRTASNQQHALSFEGGGTQNQYFLSVGYDHINQNDAKFSNDRLSLNAQNTYRLFNDKLQASVGLRFSTSRRITNAADGMAYIKPYTNLVDNEGNALPVQRFKKAWQDTIGRGNLLDWTWKPKDEAERNNFRTRIDNYVLNLDLIYKLTKDLNIQVQYQYTKEANQLNTFYAADSYYTRNLVNRFSTVDYSTNEVIRPIPHGNILDKQEINGASQNLRLRVDFSKEWGRHTVSALAGSDIKDYGNRSHTYRLYGYDEINGSIAAVDFADDYRQIDNGLSSTIPGRNRHSAMADRYVSMFSNTQYEYDDKYIISASIRIDESNLFGVKANQKKLPLVSFGASWNISKEFFESVAWLDGLRFRSTFGYNGNVDKSASAYVTAHYLGTTKFGNQSVMIMNPPNPELKWEKVEMTNFALEYSLFKGRLSGNIEYYRKRGTDIIGQSIMAPSSGVILYRGNSANISGDGFDVTIASQNIARGKFGWSTILLLSSTKDKITDYKVNTRPLAFHVGYPYNGIFSYRWAGLHPETGEPQGFYGGKPSTKLDIINNADSLNHTTEYNGSGTPTFFGSIRNNVKFKNFNLSVNIIYKLGYFFRANSVDYGRLFGLDALHEDYNQRWLKPGDELKTQVPAAIYPSNFLRDDFYLNSSILIEKGDHVRLQDVRLSYDIGKRGAVFKNASFYVFGSNLGLIWKANKKGIDPDSQLRSSQKSISVGFKSHF